VKEGIINIPMKPYVAVYLEKMYGTPINISKNAEIYLCVKSLLSGKKIKKTTPHTADISTELIDVKVLLPYTTCRRHGQHLSNESICNLVAFFEQYIKSQILIATVTLYINNDTIKQTDALRSVYESFGFTEDTFSFDTLLRYFKRNTALPNRSDTGKSPIGGTIYNYM
jgi:hypothetical protein